MSKYPKVCKGCVYLHPVYKKKDKSGNRVISGYNCSAGYGDRVPGLGLKHCEFRKERM